MFWLAKVAHHTPFGRKLERGKDCCLGGFPYLLGDNEVRIALGCGNCVQGLLQFFWSANDISGLQINLISAPNLL